MATSYPSAFQQFPTMLDITAVDAPIVKQYQEAVQAGDYTRAQQLLQSISNYGQKIITAELLNQLFDTNVALQTYYMQRYSTPYVVSETQPLAQEAGDFWIKVEADG